MSVQYGCLPKVVLYRPKLHQFKRNGTTLRGILKPIEKAFVHPNYTFEKAVYGPEHDQHVDRRSVARNRDHGLAKGKHLDKQLSRAFVFMTKLKLSIAGFLNLRNIQRKPGRPVINAAINLSKGLMSNARALLTSWAKRGLRIIGTQVPVGCVAKRLGTAIDVVLMDAQGNYYIINVKVHNYKSYDKHTRLNLLAPFTRVTDSIHHQNQLQLLAETILWRKTYPERGSGKPIPVPKSKRVLENKLYSEINICDASHMVHPFKLEEWAIAKQTEFWETLGPVAPEKKRSHKKPANK